MARTTTKALVLALLAALVVLVIPRGAEARVGLAEWRFELPGGLVVCHGDEAPDECGSVCIHDPRTQQLSVADIEDFKIYDDVVVGTTTHGEYFRLDDATRAVERFASREALDRRMDLGRSTELGRLQKLFMVNGGYSLASLAFFHGLFAVVPLAARLRVPPRWTWLVSYVVCHVLVLRFTVGEYLLLFNPYWRGGL
jgi:hypothetical protein